jgi:hypothetical protein
VAQQLAAHHRRQRQRHEARDQHRAGQRQRELAEQPPGAPGREGQRREHRRQRQRHRHHGEADLAHALDGRLEGRQPSSMWRKMFSSTTMASSTTRPMASTRASRVSVLT